MKTAAWRAVRISRFLPHEHDLKIGTIADLIQYRIKNEKTVERVTSCNLPTEHGEFQLVAYQDVIGNEMHLALVKGEDQCRPPDPGACTCAEHAVRLVRKHT